MRVTLAALALLVALAGTASAAGSPIATDPAPGLTPAQEAAVPLLSTARLYPYVGVEERYTFSPVEFDHHDLIWNVGVAYSLGGLAPSIGWRWNPEEGADINELVIGLRWSLRTWPLK